MYANAEAMAKTRLHDIGPGEDQEGDQGGKGDGRNGRVLAIQVIKWLTFV